MKLKLFVVTGLLFVAATAKAAPQYNFVKTEINGPAKIDPSDGSATYELQYTIQPCAQEFVKFIAEDVDRLVTDHMVGNAVYRAIGALVKSNGRQCAGPTRNIVEQYKIPGPLPLGGVVLYSIEPVSWN